MTIRCPVCLGRDGYHVMGCVSAPRLPSLSWGWGEVGLALFAFGLTVVQIPRVTAAAILPGWTFLSLTLPFMVARIRMTAPHWLGIAFLIYAAASVAWSPAGVESLWHLGVLALCFCLGSSLSDLRPIYIGLALGLNISSVIVLFQINGFDVVAQVHPPAGLFVNKLVLGWLACLVLVALASERLWWFIPGLIPSVLLTEARSAILGAAAALAAWFWPRSRMGAVGVGLGVALMAAAVVHLNYRPEGLQERQAIWADTAEALTLQGRGLGSFLYYFPAIDTRMDAAATRAEHAHNDFLEFAFELGVGALPLDLLILLLLVGETETPPDQDKQRSLAQIMARAQDQAKAGIPRKAEPRWKIAGETERLVFIAFLVMAFFGFPTFIPTTAFVGALVAGRLARNWCMVRWQSDTRRSHLHPGLGAW